MTRSDFLRTTLTQALALALFCSIGSAQRWEYLGQANLDGGGDHDRIAVGVSRGAFRRIQFLVEKSAVHFDRVVVHYGDGASFPVEIPANIPPGGRTREIDLAGQKRGIESVEIWYRRGGWRNGERPRVRLMGIRW